MAAKVPLKSIFCPTKFYFIFDSNRGSRNAIMVFCRMPIILELNTIIKCAEFILIRLRKVDFDIVFPQKIDLHHIFGTIYSLYAYCLLYLHKLT